jgi:hypothetical protein
MRIPRNVSGARLADLLCRKWQYARVHQVGSHIILETDQPTHHPIVDSKKREMIGNLKNSGAKWDRSPVLVNDHDFRSDASGVGISSAFTTHPATAAPSAFGASHDRPAFAAHSIATWRFYWAPK